MLSKNTISLIRSLSGKQARDHSGLFIVEGRKLVAEAVSSGFGIDNIFYSKSYPELPDGENITGKEMERISRLKTPQGVLALVKIPTPVIPESPGERLSLVLDCIQDPGNLGTILRIADWFGIENIYCSRNTADIYNPKVVQATMGAIFRVKCHYMDIPGLLSRSVYPVYGTFLQGENIYDMQISDPYRGFIVMGNEGNGISGEVGEHIGRKISIPSFARGNTASESLNVAVATAIACSEFRRRKQIMP